MECALLLLFFSAIFFSYPGASDNTQLQSWQPRRRRGTLSEVACRRLQCGDVLTGELNTGYLVRDTSSLSIAPSTPQHRSIALFTSVILLTFIAFSVLVWPDQVYI